MGKTIEGQQKINRYKIGSGSNSNPPLKQTGFTVMATPLSQPMPSRPQVKERMGVGGTKATMRHKGRVDPKAADPKEVASTPIASGEVNWPTPDKNAQQGYVVGKAWPLAKSHTGPNPYAARAGGGGPVGGYRAEGLNAQGMEGSYTESGQDT